MVNPSTAQARVVVDELIRGGVRDVVLCPGSRNAPLAFALHDADRAGRLRLHVRIDERTAGFLALGIAKSSRRPAAVVTTSGTAAGNLHPAMMEAAQKNPGAANLVHIPGFLLLGGGVPVRVGNDVIGAVGIGGAPGGHLDEQCANAALEKVKGLL